MLLLIRSGLLLMMHLARVKFTLEMTMHVRELWHMSHILECEGRTMLKLELHITKSLISARQLDDTDFSCVFGVLENHQRFSCCSMWFKIWYIVYATCVHYQKPCNLCNRAAKCFFVATSDGSYVSKWNENPVSFWLCS